MAPPPVKSKNPRRRLVSFGKIFLTFIMPSLMKSAEAERIDEIQINFYQLNEACGPLSLQNIAEFPVEIDMFKDQMANYIVSRGGEAMTAEEFLGFFSERIMGDNRAPGYGMRSFYQPYDADKPQETKSGDDSEFQAKITSWYSTYGSFKKPSLGMRMEDLPIGSPTTKGEVPLNPSRDLLYKLQGTIAAGYYPVADAGPDKLIRRIHIYDKTMNPYVKKTQSILSDGNGNFFVRNGEETAASAAALKERLDGELPNPSNNPAATSLEVSVTENGVTTPVKYQRIKGGQNMLRDMVESSVPTILIGANSSMITTATMASKMDGLLGTINALGGSYKAKSTLSPNGLSQAENSLPMRVIPSQLTMTSMGCPIAEVYQTFFINLGTGTTIDNLYACTQLQHNITPGKFETNWTFSFTDGYGRFFGATSINNFLEKIQKDKPTSAETPPAANGKPPAPKK
jgi:hypothetical protein